MKNIIFLYLIFFKLENARKKNFFTKNFTRLLNPHTPKKKNSFPHNYNIEQIYIFFFFKKYIKTQNSKFMMD